MKEDWIEVELFEVCNGTKGKKPSTLESKSSEKVNVPYINIKAFEKGIIDEYTDGEKCNLCNEGDLLMVWDGARAGLTGKAKKGAVGSTLMKFQEIKGIEKQYLYYFLLSLFTKINTNPRGVGIPHVEPRILWYSKLLIVSSPIQRAIVAKIEALFSDLDNGIANFKKAQEQLKIYRQAVLKKAFEGELTKEWREKQNNLPTAEELLKQIKEERQNHYNQQIEDWKKAVKEWEKKGSAGKKPSKPTQLKELSLLKEKELKELPLIPDSWFYSEIGNICDCIVPNRDKPKSFSGDIKWITTPDLDEKLIKLDYSKIKIGLTKNEAEKYNARVIPINSVIMTCVGTLGLSTIVEKEIVINQQLHAFLPENYYLPKSLAYYIRLNKNFYEKISTSTTIQYVNKDKCNSLPFPICSVAEQTQIVKEIESRLSVCDKVEQSINESIEKAEALRQSILKKAFEGKLLSKVEIELCKKETDYEPASELLKKIKAEKLAKEQEKKKPRKK